MNQTKNNDGKNWIFNKSETFKNSSQCTLYVQKWCKNKQTFAR